MFISGLSYETNDSTLRGAFEKFGTLTKCKLLYNKGKAFVEYETHELAKEALANLNESQLDGRTLYIEFSGDPVGGPRREPAGSGAPGESNTLFVGNVPFSADENMIRNHFGKAGTVNQVRIPLKEDGYTPKGFCHVEFATPADATNALNTLAG